MTALFILALTFIAGAILYAINNAVITFNEHCQQKFYTKFLTFKAYSFTLLSFCLLCWGIFFLFLAAPAYHSLFNGLLLLSAGLGALFLLFWHNFQRTDLKFALIGNSTLFFSALFFMIPPALIVYFALSLGMCLAGALPIQSP